MRWYTVKYTVGEPGDTITMSARYYAASEDKAAKQWAIDYVEPDCGFDSRGDSAEFYRLVSVAPVATKAPASGDCGPTSADVMDLYWRT